MGTGGGRIHTARGLRAPGSHNDTFSLELGGDLHQARIMNTSRMLQALPAP